MESRRDMRRSHRCPPVVSPPGIGDFRGNRLVRWPAISLLPLQLPWLVQGRCLFIDADTLVMRDVSELMAVDLEGMPLAAAMDIGVDTSWTLRTPKGRLTRIGAMDFLQPRRSRRRRQSMLRRLLHMGMRPGDMYFNSGVLVMDCDAIRDLPPEGHPRSATSQCLSHTWNSFRTRTVSTSSSPAAAPGCMLPGT